MSEQKYVWLDNLTGATQEIIWSPMVQRCSKILCNRLIHTCQVNNKINIIVYLTSVSNARPILQ